MRKEFVTWLDKKMTEHQQVILLTGDLGYNAFEPIQEKFKDRFINVGVAEQNMIMIAAGLASEGFLPICYSIAPFMVFRAYEQARLDLGIHQLKAILVGNGGGYGYGIMGATHHALEDLAAMSALPNFRCFIPVSNEDLAQTANACFDYDGPSYLRLGFGSLSDPSLTNTNQAIRKLTSGTDLTVIGVGPVSIEAHKAIESSGKSVDLFILNEMPIPMLSVEFLESVSKSKKLLVIEEHVQRGGLAEMISYHLAKEGIQYCLFHRYAVGYPNKKYGNQDYHLQQSGLDASSLKVLIQEIV